MVTDDEVGGSVVRVAAESLQPMARTMSRIGADQYLVKRRAMSSPPESHRGWYAASRPGWSWSTTSTLVSFSRGSRRAATDALLTTLAS